MDHCELAECIVSAAANMVCLDMRFLTMAVLSMKREVVPGSGPPSCDGETLRFHEDSVIYDYKNERNSVSRQLAHCVLHRVLGHCGPCNSFQVLAEDMIVEYVLDSLDTPHISVPERDDRMYVCEKFFKRIGAPAPDLLASELKDISTWQGELYVRMFCIDDGNIRPDDDTGEWRELAQQAMVEIEGFIKRRGEGTEALMSVLRIRNRRRYDYRSFLRKFMTSKHRVKENLDEFDPIYYTYGLKTYGNIPLIDSLESSDTPSVEEFVIAIDTSGSTMKGPVVAFLEEVYSVLRQSGISRGVNLHVMQCDDTIRSDFRISSEEDMRRMVSSFELTGGGGTDFRPVFALIEELIGKGEFRNLRGMMYFTDGMGTFPEKRPPYDTVFVFCDDCYREHIVPPWAMKLVIRSDDLPAKGAIS